MGGNVAADLGDFSPAFLPTQRNSLGAWEAELTSSCPSISFSVVDYPHNTFSEEY